MGNSIERLIDDVERMRKLFIRGLFVLVVAFVLFEALRGEHFWNKIKGEGNLWNYGSSLLYFTAGQLAILNAVLFSHYSSRHHKTLRSWSWLVWCAAGVAFAYFACDEMLEIHEKVGLAIEASLPWVSNYYSGRADNLITAAYGIGGLLFVFVFLRGMPTGRVAGVYLLAATVAICLASAMDIIPRELYQAYLPLRESEELLEVTAGFMFSASFASSASLSVQRILDAHASSPSEERSRVA